jgi:hypothetical protein
MKIFLTIFGLALAAVIGIWVYFKFIKKAPPSNICNRDLQKGASALSGSKDTATKVIGAVAALSTPLVCDALGNIVGAIGKGVSWAGKEIEVGAKNTWSGTKVGLRWWTGATGLQLVYGSVTNPVGEAKHIASTVSNDASLVKRTATRAPAAVYGAATHPLQTVSGVANDAGGVVRHPIKAARSVLSVFGF